MTKIVPLEQANNKEEFGGKASNLAQLVKLQMLVPQGLAVGLSAFNRQGKLDQAGRQALRRWLDTNGPQVVFAVRSSGTNEDGNKHSWAGQFETFLNVNKEQVIKMVEKCHSGNTERAQAYARKLNEDLRVAVIVQEMVIPNFAGVLFTKNPIDGSEQIIMEYVKGLGDALVGGEENPESCMWDKNKRKLTEGHPPFNVQELFAAALKIEKAFGKPQDIEWAISGQKLYMLQTRPITTLNT